MLRVSTILSSCAVLTACSPVLSGGSRRLKQDGEAAVLLEKAAAQDPCAVIRAAFETDRPGCAPLRDEDGAIRIAARIRVEGKVVPLLRPGEECDGGYVGVQPVDDWHKPFVSYLDVGFRASDDKEYVIFGGNRVRWIPPCEGPHCGTIGKGCFDVQGALAFHDGMWRRIGPVGGCLEGRSDDTSPSRDAVQPAVEPADPAAGTP